jgi:(2Fe-2S) ferredoxin
MPTYAELTAQVEANRRRLAAQDRPRIAVCIDTSSIAVGALETLANIRSAVQAAGIDVDVDQVGGNGMSFANPVVEVSAPGGQRILYQHVKPEDASEFVQAVLVRREAANQWTLGAVEGSADGVPPMSDQPWYALQDRRLMAEMGLADPENVDDYVARGAYSGLARALSMTQEEVIAEVSGSKVGGRGGSFFPVGRKWDFLRTSPTNPKAIVCNADEGDGGAWSTA